MTRRASTRPATVRRWRFAALAGLAVAIGAGAFFAFRKGVAPHPSPTAAEPAAFAGTTTCRDCHVEIYERWLGSDHDLAMSVANDKSVLGDFDDATIVDRGLTTRFYRRDGRYLVFTEGPEGAPAEFEVTYTFGVRPLQQYLVPFPGGRLQALPIAWDTLRSRWFHLYPDRKIAPDDWLHWTRNGQNWNGMCAECHSTNLRKNYDPESATFSTTWSELNVGCEACHGPGSRHVAWARSPPASRPSGDRGLVVATRGGSARRAVELCAACHSRRSELGDYDHTGGELLDEMLPSLLEAGLYEADGQQRDEVYNYGSFVQSRMYARGLTCSDCHDPHAAKLRATGNAACVRCHNPAGAALRDGIDGSGLKLREYDSPAHHFHRAGGPGSACVDCHAPARAYMVFDPRHDHSFRIPRPDLTAATGSPNACNGCHTKRSSAWAAEAVAKWYGPNRRPEAHYGEQIAAGREHRPGAAAGLAALAADGNAAAIVRATALELLSSQPGGSASDALRQALRDPDPLVRQAAAGAIEIEAPAERIAALGGLLSDPVRAVRLAAVSGLAGSTSSMPPAIRDAFDRARVEYEAAMRHSLDFASSGLNLGNLYSRLGEAEEAERYYRAALAVDDLFYPAKSNLAVLLSGHGRNEEAERLLREILAAYPDNADAAQSLGLLLVEMDRPGEAVDFLRRAAQGIPAPPRAAYNLGLLLARLGRAGEARTVLARALALSPGDWDLLFALADLELRNGRAREALGLAERMMAQRPEDPTARALRAAAASAIGEKPGSGN